MPRNTQGGYSLPLGTLVKAGETVLTGQHNPAMQDIEQALTGSLSREGRGGMLAPLAMGNNVISGLAPGVLPNDAATVAQASVIPPADNAYSTLDGLKASATARKSAQLVNVPGVSNGPFFWTLAAPGVPFVADDVNVIKSDSTPLSVGAWVRQGAAGIKDAGGSNVQATLNDYRAKIPATQTDSRDATFDGFSTTNTAAQNSAALAVSFSKALRVTIPGDQSVVYNIDTFQMPAQGQLYSRAKFVITGDGIKSNAGSVVDLGWLDGGNKTNTDVLLSASNRTGFRIAVQKMTNCKRSALQVGNCTNFSLSPGTISNVGDPAVINATSEGMGLALFGCSDFSVDWVSLEQTYGLGAVFLAECQRGRFGYVKAYRTRYRGIDIEGNTTRQLRFEQVDIQQTGYYAPSGVANNGVGTNGIYIGPIIDKNEVQIVAGLIDMCGENCLEGTYTTSQGLTCQRSGWAGGQGGTLDTPSKEVVYISGGGAAINGGLFKNGFGHIIVGGPGDQGPTTIIGAELVKPGGGFYAVQAFALNATLSEIILDNVICKKGDGGTGAGGVNLAVSGTGTFVRSYAANCKSDFTTNNIDASVAKTGNLPTANFP